jgi:toxin CptA
LNRYNAPPVVFPLGRSRFLGYLLLALWLAGFFSALPWWYDTRHLDWRMALAFIAVLLAGLAARTSWVNLPRGQLAWDGQVWCWESASYQTGMAEHELSVIADFQHRLLLRLENQARASLWLWVEQNAMPERWLDLRRAVYSPHRSPPGQPPHDFLLAEPTLPSSAVAVSIVMHPVNVPRANKP